MLKQENLSIRLRVSAISDESSLGAAFAAHGFKCTSFNKEYTLNRDIPLISATGTCYLSEARDNSSIQQSVCSALPTTDLNNVFERHRLCHCLEDEPGTGN